MGFDESIEYLMEQEGWTVVHENKMYLAKCNDNPDLKFACSTQAQIISFYDGIRLGKKQFNSVRDYKE